MRRRYIGSVDATSTVDAVDLSPRAFARLLAPAIDRVFRGGMHAARDRGGRELVGRHGGSDAVGWLIEFRTALAWPGREVSADGFAAVTRYRDADQCRASLSSAAQRGALELTADGGFRATDRGHEFLTELYRSHAKATADLCADHRARVERLLDSVAVVLDAALAPLLDGADATRRGAFAAMAPPYEPPEADPGLLLLNRLGTLRYHRADAHAAAWVAAGLTAAQIAAMPDGPAREAIENETDRRAAPPFAAIRAPSRLTVLADLAGLPA